VTAVRIRRGFADLGEGQVHFRTAGEPGPGRVPLVMLHASPGSAKTLEPLIAALAPGRPVIGLDTLGNGDSDPPAPPGQAAPTIEYFAGAHVRALDTLGIGRFDLYGTHTGANLAVEIAIAHPGRVRRLILDGISLYTAEQRADMLARYAPEVAIDSSGAHLIWVWQFVRDVYLFWPWYRRDAASRRPIGLPDPDALHDKVVEVLKAARTYHIPYRVAIGYDKERRLPLVAVPTLLACPGQDMFMEYFDRVRALLPASRAVITAGTGSAAALASTVAVFEEFLAAPEPTGPA
jgi:pimeloyl-ACP methyl ester carboxylesterase